LHKTEDTPEGGGERCMEEETVVVVGWGVTLTSG